MKRSKKYALIEAKPKDAKTFVRLDLGLSSHEKSIAKGVTKDFESYNEEKLAKDLEKRFNKAVKAKDKKIVIALDKKKPIGFAIGIICKPERWATKAGNRGQIGKLYVIEEYRGKGAARQLKDYLMEWFKEKECTHAGIGVLTDNKQAKTIYRKWGFKPYALDLIKRI